MKNVVIPDQKLSPNFIGGWTIDPLSICDELVSYFESHAEKQTKGESDAGKNLDIKNSTDIKVLPHEIEIAGNKVFVKYFSQLFSFYKDYTQQWPFLNSFANKLQIGEFNLQRYQSGEHFQSIHTERSSISTLHRVFAWMTYLNDVDIKNGGATVFSHFGLEIQPKKGLTLIWPAEWTHAHKGNLLQKGSKYIITGWMHFPYD